MPEKKTIGTFGWLSPNLFITIEIEMRERSGKTEKGIKETERKIVRTCNMKQLPAWMVSCR